MIRHLSGLQSPHKNWLMLVVGIVILTTYALLW